MAIRDRFRRALHKSTSSESNISDSPAITTTTTANTTVTTSSSETSSQPASLHRQPTNNSKFAMPWSRTEKEKEQRKEDKEKKKEARRKRAATTSSARQIVHPRDKPLTASNLRHQEMLGGFDFSFGSSPGRMDQLVPAGPFDIGVSPCCTRPGSINGDALSPLEEDDDSDVGPGPLTAATSDADLPKVAVSGA